MANSIRDMLDDAQGYQISYRPPSVIRLPGRDPGQAALSKLTLVLTYVSARRSGKRTAADAVTAALKYGDRDRSAHATTRCPTTLAGLPGRNPTPRPLPPGRGAQPRLNPSNARNAAGLVLFHPANEQHDRADGDQ
jgi:hypothetical protein